MIGAMREAYQSTNADTARKRLRSLVSWLENSGHDGAAASLCEGLEETLTVIKLGLPKTLTRSLATTNPIESLMSQVRRTTRHVKRWRGGDMIKRWVALGVFSAQKRFRRIKGHKDMPARIHPVRAGRGVGTIQPPSLLGLFNRQRGIPCRGGHPRPATDGPLNTGQFE